MSSSSDLPWYKRLSVFKKSKATTNPVVQTPAPDGCWTPTVGTYHKPGDKKNSSHKQQLILSIQAECDELLTEKQCLIEQETQMNSTLSGLECSIDICCHKYDEMSSKLSQYTVALSNLNNNVNNETNSSEYQKQRLLKLDGLVNVTLPRLLTDLDEKMATNQHKVSGVAAHLDSISSRLEEIECQVLRKEEQIAAIESEVVPPPPTNTSTTNTTTSSLPTAA